jgi:predicted CoA-binding protein
MTIPAEVLMDTESIVLIDWPSRDVPDTLARAGYHVVSQDGPGDEGYNAYESTGPEIVVRATGVAPDHADLVYTHRPFDELPEIVDFARRIGARAIWSEAGPDTSGAEGARRMVEAAGLVYIDAPRITAAVRDHRRPRPPR